MKVNLVVQLSSTSVADTLKWCKMKKNSGFEECDGPLHFIKIFNNLFNILNSRSIREKYLKQAINENYEVEIFSMLETAEYWIFGLKEKSDKLVLNGSRKIGFIGFLMCINNMRSMYSKTCVIRKTMGTNIFSALGTFPYCRELV